MPAKKRKIENKFPEFLEKTINANDWSMRDFARNLGEDPSDVHLWSKHKRAVTPRAVLSICRFYPEVKPHDLNPVIFPKNLKLVWE